MLETKRLDDFRVVLISPLYSGNVGSVARLAMNFGVRDVVLVNPGCDPLDAEAQKFACKLSQQMLRSFRIVDSVAAAIADCTSVVGFSRRTGEFRMADVTLDALLSLQRRGKIALVFGREDNGISRDEILQCTHVCSIPSSSDCPSLNLSHAVAVVLSHLFAFQENSELQTQISGPSQEEMPASAEAFEEFMAHWRETLVAVGLTKAGNPQRMMPHLRRIFQRARVTDKDVRLVRVFLGNALAAVGARTRRKTL